jgi:trans-aconitate methyltransferase
MAWTDRFVRRPTTLPEEASASGIGYANRNDRLDCVCGERRVQIADRIWWVSDFQDQITPHYYYRCSSCQSFSAVNLHFEPSSYTEHHIDAYCIPDSKMELNHKRVGRIIESFRGHIPDRPTIYDLGSGEGAFTKAFRQALPQASIIAVEADARMQDKFSDIYADVTFVPEYIETFLQRADSAAADIVLLTDVLEHVLDPASMIRSVMAALKPGGIAYLTVPNALSFPSPRAVPADQVDWSLANITRQHLWMLAPQTWLDLMVGHGDLVEYSRSFEENIRRDAQYSTFILRKMN